MLAALQRVARRLLPEAAYVRARSAFVSRAIRAYEPRVVSHSYSGVRLRLSLEDPAAEEWYGGDRYWVEFDKVTPQRGDLVFDLGAHQAVVAMLLARKVGPQGRVIAVEADSHNVRVARRNLDLNEITNVEVVGAAIADRQGTARFASGLNGHLTSKDGNAGVAVPTITIDGLAERYGHPSAIVLDVEGAEALALAGAAQTIERGARFLIEVHAGFGLEDLGGSADELASWLAGYRIEALGPDNVWHEGPGRADARSFWSAEPKSE
jgi:FkbM family methyltransferase